MSFLQLDIVDFYPSISQELLDNSLLWAKSLITIDADVISTITNARKTLLFSDGVSWQKNTGLSDVTQGGLDSCQMCELVGLYLLKQVKDSFPLLDFGLYRDDGLAIHQKLPGPELNRMEKDIIALFKENNLNITIQTGMLSVDFLDITLDISTNSYKPYKKPNSDLLYVHKNSNHPNSVLKHIPNSVNQRLINISSDITVFEEAKEEYERALVNSGHKQKLTYTVCSEENDKKTKPKNRKRNIIWYNPPYNISLKTDFGYQFLKLIKKHFPANHMLHPVINRNNVKLSYSTTKNMKRIIQGHNNKILSKTEDSTKTCSCIKSKKDKCPLNNKCLSKTVVYKATVQQSNKFYIGITENTFKDRYTQHKSSFKNEKNKNATSLSQHIWEIGQNITDSNPEPGITWEILKKSYPRKPGASECQLCLEEKLQILKASKNKNSLNKRTELPMRCITFHRAKHKLSNL